MSTQQQRQQMKDWKCNFIANPERVALRSFTVGHKAYEYRLMAMRALMYLRAEKTDKSLNRHKHMRAAIVPVGSNSITIYWRPMLYLEALGLVKKKTQRRYYADERFRNQPWGYVISEKGMTMDLYDVIGSTFDIAHDNNTSRERGHQKQQKCPAVSSASA